MAPTGAEIVEQRLLVAEHLLSTGAFDRAEDVLDQVAADAMDLPWFWVLRARSASGRGDAEGAIRAARAGLARFPEEVALLVALGREHADLGQLEEAEQALLAALAVDPEDVEALCAYADAVARAGQTDKAARLVDRAATLEPGSARVVATRYQLAHLAGDDQQTARLAGELARVTEGNPHALALLGLEAAKRSDVRASRDLLHRAARGDVRVVDALGPEVFREARVATHPLMWPLWPVQRFGPGPVWIAFVVTFVAVRSAGLDEVAIVLGVTWLAWVVYTWVVPPLVRRLARQI